MRLGILSVGGEIGCNGCYALINITNLLLELNSHPVHPLCQHLLAFNNKVKLMLDILFDDSDPMIERLNYLFLKVRQD
jgi:hypothetical protein